jgi:hypothetical protein
VPKRTTGQYARPSTRRDQPGPGPNEAECGVRLISAQICLQLGSTGLQGRSETMVCR